MAWAIAPVFVFAGTNATYTAWLSKSYVYFWTPSSFLIALLILLTQCLHVTLSTAKLACIGDIAAVVAPPHALPDASCLHDKLAVAPAISTTTASPIPMSAFRPRIDALLSYPMPWIHGPAPE